MPLSLRILILTCLTSDHNYFGSGRMLFVGVIQLGIGRRPWSKAACQASQASDCCCHDSLQVLLRLLGRHNVHVFRVKTPVESSADIEFSATKKGHNSLCHPRECLLSQQENHSCCRLISARSCNGVTIAVLQLSTAPALKGFNCRAGY